MWIVDAHNATGNSCNWQTFLHRQPESVLGLDRQKFILTPVVKHSVVVRQEHFDFIYKADNYMLV